MDKIELFILLSTAVFCVIYDGPTGLAIGAFISFL